MADDPPWAGGFDCRQSVEFGDGSGEKMWRALGVRVDPGTHINFLVFVEIQSFLIHI